MVEWQSKENGSELTEVILRCPHARGKGGGREDQPHVQGAVAAWAQEGLEDLSHIEGQEGWR